MTTSPADDALNARHAEKMKRHQAARAKIMAGKTADKGLIIVHTGPGKGKTSAALGMVFRHIAHSIPAAVVQFTKSPDFVTGEAILLRRFPELCTLEIMGDGFTWDTQDRAADIASARAAWERAKDLIRDDRHGLVLSKDFIVSMEGDWEGMRERRTRRGRWRKRRARRGRARSGTWRMGNGGWTDKTKRRLGRAAGREFADGGGGASVGRCEIAWRTLKSARSWCSLQHDE